MIRKVVLRGLSIPTPYSVLCVTMRVLEEQLWGHTEDLLMAGAQQQPSPDTAVPLAHPQRYCKDQHVGQSRCPLASSQAALHKSLRKKTGFLLHFSFLFSQKEDNQETWYPLPNHFSGQQQDIKKAHTGS